MNHGGFAPGFAATTGGSVYLAFHILASPDHPHITPGRDQSRPAVAVYSARGCAITRRLIVHPSTERVRLG